MLAELHIRDFAVIESLDIEFDAGMTVFTGETGAGKSIIVDAMGLILGDRADSSVIRGGREKSEITARFSIDEASLLNPLLQEQEIEVEDEIFIRRVINQDGRSKAFVNGTPTPIQFLKKIATHLVDIHGQHAHQSLMHKGAQCDLLDVLAKHPELIKKVNDHYQLWIEIQSQLNQLTNHNDNRDAQLNLLKYQVEELQALELKENEYEQINQEFKRLNNATAILQTLENSMDAIAESDGSVLTQIQQIKQSLENLRIDDPALRNMIECLGISIIQLEEAHQEARNHIDTLEVNPEKLFQIENRMSNLHETARKHHIQPQQLEEHFAKLRSQLDELEGSETRFQELVALAEKAKIAYQKAAKELHISRVREAKKMDHAILLKLQELGMAGARFETQIQFDIEASPQKKGLDKVEFLVSANPGQPLKPIGKVASGGELSRISLAIQVINHENHRIPTFVFDEVDAGIGGNTADVVGKLLYSLTDGNQIFCVTHLPQVACYGDHHFHVKKITENETTYTELIALEEKGRVAEIARMLGGEQTDKSLAHATELLATKQRVSAA